MATNTHYKCIVEGDYFAKEADGKVIKHYNLEFNIPDLGEDKSDTHYMSVIKSNLLNKQLKAKYPSAITYRTHEMVDRILIAEKGQTTSPVKQTDPTKSISSMNKTELTTFIQSNYPEIDLEINNTVDKMRQAVYGCQEDKEKFLKEQADIKAEIELQRTLNDLNPTPPIDPNDPGTGGGENPNGDNGNSGDDNGGDE